MSTHRRPTPAAAPGDRLRQEFSRRQGGFKAPLEVAAQPRDREQDNIFKTFILTGTRKLIAFAKVSDRTRELADERRPVETLVESFGLFIFELPRGAFFKRLEPDHVEAGR